MNDMLNDTDVAYIAGLFDGEGHVSITWTYRKSGRDPKLCVKLSNTYLPVILKIQDMFGGTIYSPVPTEEHYLQVFHLSFNVSESKVFLKTLMPFLVIKYEQAYWALKFSDTVYRRGRKKVTEEEHKLRNLCMDKVRELKQAQWSKNFNKEEVMVSYEDNKKLLSLEDI